ncbi:cytochrome P450 [Crassisporium funariophilum]|nr:cytochrome P450 [Crassisporium funariophilum]
MLVSLLLFLFIAFLAFKWRARLQSKKGTQLRGPPSKSLLFGMSSHIRLSQDAKALYQGWYDEYGSVYRYATPFGTEAVVVSDFKAAVKILAKDTFGYVKTPELRFIVEHLIGRGVVWAEGDSHKRQRRSLNPAFSTGAIKGMTGIFYDSAYKMKTAWEKILENGTTEIEMHEWTTKLSLDCIGLAAFGHDFKSLDGEYSVVYDDLHIFNTTLPSALSLMFHVAQAVIPLVTSIPTKRAKLFQNLSDSTRQIFENLLAERKKLEDPKNEPRVRKGGKSALDLLLDAETSDTSLRIDKDEFVAQMKAILIAGSDPPGLTIVWALIELSRSLKDQRRLREEISMFPEAEPTWDQLQSSFPFLEAVISETLRLHPSISETARVANADDIIHLSTPIIDAAGNATDQIHITKGTQIIIPNHHLNCSTSLWGQDATEFKPERWLSNPSTDSDDTTSQRMRIWTFGEGQRVCVGKAFALAQIKIVLSVIIRNFTFELPNGPQTPVGIHLSLIPRPTTNKTEGASVALKVGRVH